MSDSMRSLPAVCAVGLAATSADDVLRHVADRAVHAGLAAATFGDALVTREHAYPTGLPTVVPVAIPHADPAHVLHAGFAVVTLANPVSFGVMGTESDRVDLDIVIVLLVTQAHSQVEVLGSLIELVQRDGWDATLRAAATPEALAAAFDELLAA